MERWLKENLEKEQEKYNTEIDGLRREKDKPERYRKKLLEAHYNDALPLDLLKSEQQKIAKQLAAVDNQIKMHAFAFSEMRERLDEALDLIEDCGATYRQAGDHVKKLLNQTIFSRVLVGDGGQIEPEFAEPFGMLTEAADAVKVEQRSGNNRIDIAKNEDDNAEIRDTSVFTDFLSSTSNRLSNSFGQGWINSFLVGEFIKMGLRKPHKIRLRDSESIK